MPLFFSRCAALVGLLCLNFKPVQNMATLFVGLDIIFVDEGLVVLCCFVV